MTRYHPTLLDLALAADPVAEADSRAIAAAATPSWAVLDAAAKSYAAALEEGRRRLALETEMRAQEAKASPSPIASAA